jgi:hypothetical protein
MPPRPVEPPKSVEPPKPAEPSGENSAEISALDALEEEMAKLLGRSSGGSSSP